MKIPGHFFLLYFHGNHGDLRVLESLGISLSRSFQTYSGLSCFPLLTPPFHSYLELDRDEKQELKSAVDEFHFK